MDLQIELFGIARRRIGTPMLTLHFPGATCDLRDVMEQLTRRYPTLQNDAVIRDQQLITLIACIDGESGDRFVRQLDSVIQSGERLLLMSSDVGG